MKFLCLAAVYNHKQEWIETLVRSLIDQDHDDEIHIVILDDRKEGFKKQLFVGHQLGPTGAKRFIYTVSMPGRAPNLLTKYAHGITFADEIQGIKYDAVCVVDDDDIYLKDHISQHAAVLKDSMWSYPSKVFSTYMRQFRIEESGGRFWASSAYRRTALEGIGGYNHVYRDVLDPAFDQLFLHRMQVAYGEAGHQVSPTYVYMWDMTHDNHSSGHINNGVWEYGEIPESPATGPLIPQYSQKALEVYEMAKVFRGI
jgi:hypothetical protein